MQARVERTDTSDQDAVLVVTGSLDLTSRHQLADAVQEVLRPPAPKTLTVDLAGVDFIDSTGLGTLVAARGDAEDDDVQLVLRAPSRGVHRILDISGLLDVFAIVPAEDQPAS